MLRFLSFSEKIQKVASPVIRKVSSGQFSNKDCLAEPRVTLHFGQKGNKWLGYTFLERTGLAGMGLMPMVDFCTKVAAYQYCHGRYMILENPQSSRM